MNVIFIKQTELPQPLQSDQMHQHTEVRACGCDGEVADTATCVGMEHSHFTQPTNRSLFLHDRPNFLFLTTKQGI